MLEFYVNNQTLRLYTPVIAADTYHYLTGVVHHTDHEWDGYIQWIHFAQGEGPGRTEYAIALNGEGAFDENAALTLTVGEWEVFLIGADGDARLTTAPVGLTVKPSGLIDAPLGPMPLSVAEQIDAKAGSALDMAAYVKELADSGAFDGEDGKSFVIKGFYDTYDDLVEAVPDPEVGVAYGVGTSAPYDIYIWDDANQQWRNNGPIQGSQGPTGADGTTFTPNVDASGNISWSNNGGKENPTTRNIKGPKGDTGASGADGKSPYEAAVEGGYEGNERTFYAALATMPFHNARHLPTGADPIVVQNGNLANSAVSTGNIANGAVTRAKLKADDGILYSPHKSPTMTNNGFSISADDIGKTYVFSSTGITATLTSAVLTALPTGAEFAFICTATSNSANFKLTVPSSYGRAVVDGTLETVTTVKTDLGYTPVTIKKISDTKVMICGAALEVVS